MEYNGGLVENANPVKECLTQIFGKGNLQRANQYVCVRFQKHVLSDPIWSDTKFNEFEPKPIPYV